MGVKLIFAADERTQKSGRKTFLLNAQKKGTMHIIRGDGPWVIGEGYATMASVHMATGWPCVVAFDCGNLPPVAEALRGKLGSTGNIIICGDADVGKDGGPGDGVKKANEAAELVGAQVVFPNFAGEVL